MAIQIFEVLSTHRIETLVIRRSRHFPQEDTLICTIINTLGAEGREADVAVLVMHRV